MTRCTVILLFAVFFIFQDSCRAAEPSAAKPVEFAKDVKPIFAKYCIECHGPSKSKGGLRLDRKADALKGGESGAVLIAGKSAASLLYQRISNSDAERVMPPRDPRLTAKEIATLKSWIDQGSNWPDDGSAATNPTDWWSLKPLEKPAVPSLANNSRIVNPIDAYVMAKLSEKGLPYSPAAEKRTLIRRLYFDLIGLPPKPEEIEAFLKNDKDDAYEKLVDQLLASPHYGERWARHWLDVVHFGETHGYDKDQPRPNAWPYRDYVIRAFNSDKPYRQFVQEQVAGDVLFPGTIDGIEALGFLAAGPWDFIGHVEVPESKIDGKVARHLDRDDFVANTIGTFMALTVHCAQCHNHKFDPISQEDYYQLQAVFAAIDRTDKKYDADPKAAAQRAELEVRKKAIAEKIASIQADARKRAGKEWAALERELAEARKPTGGPKRPEYGYHSQIAPSAGTTKWVQVDLGSTTKLEKIVLRPTHDEFNEIGAGFGFPVRFKVEVSDDPSFKMSVVVLDQTGKDYPNPGTGPVVAEAGGKSARYIRLTATKLVNRLASDYILAIAELEAWDADGKNRAAKAPVTALDSIEAPIRWRKSNLTDGIYPPGPKVTSEELSKWMSKRDALLLTALGEKGKAELAAAEADLKKTEADLSKIAGLQRVAYIGAIHTSGSAFSGTGPFGGKPRVIHILPRGDVTKPGKEVGPGAIVAIPGINGRFNLPASHTEAERRAALARWLTDPANPLTWRVMANRIWQYHFGKGLVETPNDFGKMGQLPTHPELLDWLSSDLREHQSFKRLHKLIAMSATYWQVSASNKEAEKLDSDNRYLWRQNRRKLEAEAVRDSILSVAGKLDLTMGGPSFKDFVVEKPEHSPHYEYQLHNPEDSKAHRRAIYRFLVRSKQQPFMAALDCADPSLAVDRRNQTLTPQQALALLNNPLALAMAKHFAIRVEKLGNDETSRVSAAVQIALGRGPTANELNALVPYAKEHGLANACRVILNLDEFVFVD
jgi:mono/diheme cytochrome c family protein